MIDTNPFRVWLSTMDRIRTSLHLINLNFGGFAPDWWLFIFGLMSLGLAFSVNSSAPGYWIFTVFGIVTIPYVLYFPLSFFCHRPHFFAVTNSNLQDGQYEGHAFGYWSFTYDIPAFIGPKTTTKTGNAFFSWSKGIITIDDNEILYDVMAKANILNTRYMGILKQNFKDKKAIADIEIGEATVMFRRVPTIKIREEEYGFLIALTHKTSPNTPQSSEPNIDSQKTNDK